jgi:predicted O-methyltransferase YrrM
MFSDEFRLAWPVIDATEGWLPKADAEFLFDAARAAERCEGVIVEIGSYKGRSAVALALAGTSQVYCIDTFTDVTGRGGEIYPNSVADFLRNIASAGLTDRVTPIVSTSKLAREGWGIDHNFPVAFPIKLLFIDGDHAYESVKQDYELWSPLVVTGGWVIFHDYTKPYPGVRKFVDEFVNMEPVKVGECAGFQKGCSDAA